MILAISGTPGTGKTTVAKILEKELGWKLLNLHDLAKDKGCVSGFDEERNCDIVDSDKLSEVISGLKGDFIIEAHFAHEMPSDVLVILRTHAGILRHRLRDKGWPEKKVEENVMAEIMDICVNEASEMGKDFSEIDSGREKPEETAEEILKILRSKK